MWTEMWTESGCLEPEELGKCPLEVELAELKVNKGTARY